MNGASYGWMWQIVCLNHYLQTKAWRKIICPVLIFQADNDTYVSPEQQEKFVRKLSRHQQGNVKLVKIPGTKHEIFNSGAEVLAIYWTKILLEC